MPYNDQISHFSFVKRHCIMVEEWVEGFATVAMGIWWTSDGLHLKWSKWLNLRIPFVSNPEQRQTTSHTALSRQQYWWPKRVWSRQLTKCVYYLLREHLTGTLWSEFVKMCGILQLSWSRLLPMIHQLGHIHPQNVWTLQRTAGWMSEEPPLRPELVRPSWRRKKGKMQFSQWNWKKNTPNL